MIRQRSCPLFKKKIDRIDAVVVVVIVMHRRNATWSKCKCFDVVSLDFRWVSCSSSFIIVHGLCLSLSPRATQERCCWTTLEECTTSALQFICAWRYLRVDVWLGGRQNGAWVIAEGNNKHSETGILPSQPIWNQQLNSKPLICSRNLMVTWQMLQLSRHVCTFTPELNTFLCVCSVLCWPKKNNGMVHASGRGGNEWIKRSA